jgi:hypothetical protein
MVGAFDAIMPLSNSAMLDQKMIIARVTGVAPSPATPDSDCDPSNPNVPVVTKPDCGGRSGKDSTEISDRVPRRGEPVLRLVWNAPSRA